MTSLRRRTFLGALSAAVAAAAGLGQAEARRKRRRKKRRPAHPVAWMNGRWPNVLSVSSVVARMDDASPIFSRRPEQIRPIASISKIAAALVVADLGLDLSGLTTIASSDVEGARGGARSRLLQGLTVSNLDLLHAALLGSDNRAVPALGRAVGLNTASLTRAMNEKAASLGMSHTHFREPTGLSQENVSTGLDCVTLLKTAMGNPLLRDVMSRQTYDAHPVSRPAIHYVSTIRPAMHRNAKILAGKTGYNDFARYCLVIAARIDGVDFVMSFLGAEGKMTRFGDFARVADWIVAHKPHRKPVMGPGGR